jgi:hydroxymethylpyrimidine pyrophosphatase-like HAD family hydrolase
MNGIKQKKIKFPPIGMRIVKSALVVFVCFFVYEIRGKKGSPFYSALAGLWCMQPYLGDSKDMGKQRLVSTVVGAVYGFIVLLSEIYILHNYNEFMGYAFSALMIILVIYTTILVGRRDAAYFACVVFLSMTVTNLGGKEPLPFVFGRILDTLIGVGTGIFINVVRLPKSRRKDILFLTDLKQLCLAEEEKISPYAERELNRMLEEGIQFTLVTDRMPNILFKTVGNLKLTLPVIVMDGAALYDIRENEYIYVYVISRQRVLELADFIETRGYHIFINSILDNLFVVYHGEFQNFAEEKLYNQMKRLPYRNYLKKRLPEEYYAVSVMVLDEEEKIESLYQSLIGAGFATRYKIVKKDSDKYTGFTYLKIYNKNAKRENMIQYLKREAGVKDVVFLKENREGDGIVKEIKRSYEQIIWRSHKNTGSGH